MDAVQEQKKRNEFCSILRELAKSQLDNSSCLDFCNRLENLYHPQNGEERFRHFYSDIFAVLADIQQSNPSVPFDALIYNLQKIRCNYQQKNEDTQGKDAGISNELKKLYDHVNLEVARIGYLEGQVNRPESVKSLENQMAKMQDDFVAKQDELNAIHQSIKKSQNNLNAMRKTIKNTQKDYITILGIFASIVLSFTAGIVFSTSVLENVHKASIYRISFAVILIGLVLVNILYGLFLYIGKLVNPQNNSTVKPLTIANVVLIGLLIVVFLAWNNGTVERRNSRLDETQEYVSGSLEVDSNMATDNIT